MNLLWLQSGGCGGCSMSLLCADTADFAGQLEGAGIRLLWHPSLSLASGADVVALLDNLLAGRIALDALCVEGALLRGPNGTGRFHLLAVSERLAEQTVLIVQTIARRRLPDRRH